MAAPFVGGSDSLSLGSCSPPRSVGAKLKHGDRAPWLQQRAFFRRRRWRKLLERFH